MTQLPPLSENSPTVRTRWVPWIVLWATSLAVVALLLAGNGRLDTQLWLATRWAVGDNDYYKWANYRAANAPPTEATPAELASRPFYMDQQPPLDSQFYKKTKWLWKAVKPIGSVWAAAVALVLVYLLSRWGWRAVTASASALLWATLVTFVVAMICGRHRPTHENGLNTWDFLRGFSDFLRRFDIKDLSFPSGHATAAFALAGVLVFFVPRSRWIVLPIAALCAFSRIAAGAHFYSDVLAGAVLGWTSSWFHAKIVFEYLLRHRDRELQFAFCGRRITLKQWPLPRPIHEYARSS